MGEAAGAPGDPFSSAAAVHLAVGDASSILERLQALPLCAEGKITSISVSAIAERLGGKWPLRRELVHDHLDRALRRQIGPAAIVLKLSDTDFLVAQPGETRLGGQLIALRCLHETLHHFLGEALIPDMIVHEVTRLTPKIVYGEQVDVAAVEAGAAEEQRLAHAQTQAHKPSEAMLAKWTPFTASDGRELRVTWRFEPVLQLKTSARIGHRVARQVLPEHSNIPLSPTELSRLSRTDLERIDFATLQRAVGRLQTSGGDKDPSLIIPISMTSLSSTRARIVLRQLLAEAQTSVQHGLICEICDVEGAPLSILSDAIAFVRPYSLYVIGRLAEPPSGGLVSLKGIGLAGLSIECPPPIHGDAEFLAWMKSRRSALKAVGKTAIVYRLPSVRAAAMAAILGLTHGSVEPNAWPDTRRRHEPLAVFI